MTKNRFFSLAEELFQNRKVIWSLAKNDFKKRFAGSYLGTIWAFIQPIVTVLVYWFVFSLGMRQDVSGGDEPYVLYLIAGLVPWFFFSDALGGATNALLEYNYLVKKVVFKISILPIVKIMSAMIVHGFFAFIMLLLFSGYKRFPDLYTLQILYYTGCIFILILGVSYATSSIVIFFRDLTPMINILLQLGVWMTPIMWKLSQFAEKTEKHPWLLIVIKSNPVYYVVNGYRDALINKVWFWERPELTLYFWGLVLVSFFVGTRLFKKLKPHFADVL